MTDQDNLTRRATAAYLRAGGMDQPAHGRSFDYAVQNTKRRGLGAEAPEHHYVRLANVAGMLATYRVLNQGKVKRLRHWLEPAFVSIHDRNRKALATTIRARSRRSGEAPVSECLTDQDHDALLQQDFGGDEELALAFGVHCRALCAGKLPRPAHAEPAYSSMTSDHREDGTVRTYACLADHRGLVAVYRLRASGRFMRMTRWPAWIVALDQEPEWREHCRRMEANRRRRRRRRMAKFQQWADGFIARTMPPAVSTVAASGLLGLGSP